MIDLFLGRKDKKIEAQAKKLGFSEILFCKALTTMNDFKVMEDYDSCIIQTLDINLLRRFIDKAYSLSLKIIVLGTSNEINRIALESKKVYALLKPDFQRKKDFLDSRDSGLNQVLCKIAKENNKLILIDIQSLSNSISLGRILQNFRLCKKFKTEIQLVNLSHNIEEMKSAFELKEMQRILLNKEHFDSKNLNLSESKNI